MAGRVDVRGLGVKVANELNGRQGESVAKRAQKRIHAALAADMRPAWRNVLDNVNYALSSGVGNTYGAGPIQVQDHNGKWVRVNIGPYLPLSQHYRRRPPRSRKFWRKSRGLPKDGRSVSLAVAVHQALRGKGRVRDDRGPLVRRGAFWTFESTFRPQGLPGVLDVILRRNFTSSTRVPFDFHTHGEALGKGAGPRSTYRLVQFPESERPLLAKIAHRLGVNARQALQNRLDARSGR